MVNKIVKESAKYLTFYGRLLGNQKKQSLHALKTSQISKDYTGREESKPKCYILCNSIYIDVYIHAHTYYMYIYIYINYVKGEQMSGC